MKMNGLISAESYPISVTNFRLNCLVDLHSHLREMVESIMEPLIDNTRKGGVEIVGGMPNTKKGLRTAEDVHDYRLFVEMCIGKGKPISFVPYLMITEETTPDIVNACVKLGIRDAKVYPFMRTTQSEYGVKRYARIIRIMRHCGRVGMRVHVHPEHPKMTFSHRDAEFAFIPVVYMLIEETEDALTEIWWEHGSDSRSIPHWKTMAETGRFVVTICAHHLASNEDDVRGDVAGVCNPSIKPETDRLALCSLVAEDHGWVIGISDSAYHNEPFKHPDSGRCSCGAYTAPFLAPLFAHALDPLLQKPGGVEVFQRFTSGNARSQLGLTQSSSVVRMVRESQVIPLQYQIGNETAVPFWGGRTLDWQIVRE